MPMIASAFPTRVIPGEFSSLISTPQMNTTRHMHANNLIAVFMIILLSLN